MALAEIDTWREEREKSDKSVKSVSAKGRSASGGKPIKPARVKPFPTLSVLSIASFSMEIWYLENLDILHLFCPKKVHAIEAEVQSRILQKGERMTISDKDKVCFLYDGKIRVGSRDAAGHEITKAILTKGEIFGENVSGQNTCEDFLVALSPVKVYILSIDQLQQLMRTHSGFYLFCMKLYGSRRLEMERRFPLLVNKGARTRIVELIEELITKRGYQVDAGWMIKNFVTEKQIAKLTATCRHTVSEVFKELQEKDIIVYQRCQLLIKQPESLKKG